MHLAYKSQYTKLTWPSNSGIAIGKERKQEVSRDRTRAINPNTKLNSAFMTVKLYSYDGFTSCYRSKLRPFIFAIFIALKLF